MKTNCEPFWTVSDREGYTVLVGLKIDPWRRDGSILLYYLNITWKFAFKHDILIPIPSSQARFTPSPASPTPSHGSNSFLITQNGQKTIRTWRPQQFREKTHFEMVVSWLIDRLIDWVNLRCHATDKLIDWLLDWSVLSININSKLWIDWLIEWAGAFSSINRSIDWLIDWYTAFAPVVTRASHLLISNTRTDIVWCGVTTVYCPALWCYAIVKND